MEILALGLFCAALILCIALDISILYALLAGLVIFSAYVLMQHHTLRELGKMLLSGVLTVKSIILMLVLIGFLTALWRSCGTIPVIVCYASRLIHPRTLLPMCFLLCCGVSMLMGTAFGTAATMGTICMAMGVSMGADPVLMGGAILGGVFFGDRCSPISTSALLVSELTGTVIFDNIRKMLRRSLLPFLVTLGIYTVLGFYTSSDAAPAALTEIFSRVLTLHPLALLPAVLILVLALFRVNVKITLTASLLCAGVLTLLLQKTPVSALPGLLLHGFAPADAEAAVLLTGGGLFSMLRVIAIICISSSYAGIFRETELLSAVRSGLRTVSRYITPFGGMLAASAVTSMISCNQTLAIMLTHQLCRDIAPEKEAFALDMEDSVVVLAPLVPWSIAGGVPLASVGAPTKSLLAAFFLYLLPLYAFLMQGVRRKKAAKT